MLKFVKQTSLLAILLLAGCNQAIPTATSTPSQSEEAKVRQVIEELGSRLQNVSLLAPDAGTQMEDHYAELVTPAMLATWQADPMAAPGRRTSSPWPERIEINGIEPVDANTYRVEAEIVEATSDQPVSRVDGEWRISGFVYAANDG